MSEIPNDGGLRNETIITRTIGIINALGMTTTQVNKAEMAAAAVVEEAAAVIKESVAKHMPNL